MASRRKNIPKRRPFQFIFSPPIELFSFERISINNLFYVHKHARNCTFQHIVHDSRNRPDINCKSDSHENIPSCFHNMDNIAPLNHLILNLSLLIPLVGHYDVKWFSKAEVNSSKCLSLIHPDLLRSCKDFRYLSFASPRSSMLHRAHLVHICSFSA